MSIEPNKPDSNDPGISTRMLLAFALTGLVLWGWPYFLSFFGVKMPETTEKPAVAQTKSATPPPPATKSSAPATAAAPAKARPNSAAEPAGSVTSASEESVTVDTDLYHVVFSNRGGVVTSWTLKKFFDHAGKALDLVNTPTAQDGEVQWEDTRSFVGACSSSGNQKNGEKAWQAGEYRIGDRVCDPNDRRVFIALKTGKTGSQQPQFARRYHCPLDYEFRVDGGEAQKLNASLFQVTQSPDKLSVKFEYSDGVLAASKSITLQQDSYLLKVESSVSQNGNVVPSLIAWRSGFGDMSVSNAASHESEAYYNAGSPKGFFGPVRRIFKGNVEHASAGDAKNGPVIQDGDFVWGGLEDQYFAAIFLPAASPIRQATIFSDKARTAFSEGEESFIGLAVGDDNANRLSLFVGPKDPEILRKVDAKLESVIDFGIFWIVAKPLFVSVQWMDKAWFNNYGWSIIVATVIINLFLFPLKLANLKSMRKMQALQPEIAKINEKYKALPLRDPRQADKNAEMMALYSKAGTNPMSGCIPMLIQMPFLWAFYTVLSVSIALRGAGWLWVTDLSQPEQLPIRILPVILVVTGFIMQKMTPMATVDPAQQKTMMLMPLMMGFIFYQASSGLVLYWLTGNLVGIAQQWILNKAMPKPETPVVAVKKNNRK